MSDIPITQNGKPALAVHEWLAIAAILGFLFTLTGISLFFGHGVESIQTGSPHYLKPQEIDVLIKGAVEHPGPITVKANSTISDALEMAKPLPNADLRKIKAASKVRNGQIITVPELEMIEITISGEVENPGKISVPKGTKLQDLSKHIRLLPEADAAKINKKRHLQSGEEVIVPRKGRKGRKKPKSLLCKNLKFDNMSF